MAFFEFLKREAPGFGNAYIVDIPPQIGIRETRRITGAYQLTAEDVLVLRKLSRHHRRQRLAAGKACRRRRRMAMAGDPAVARLQPPALPDAAAAAVSQPAGRRPLRLDDARGSIGGAGQRGLLRRWAKPPAPPPIWRSPAIRGLLRFRLKRCRVCLRRTELISGATSIRSARPQEKETVMADDHASCSPALGCALRRCLRRRRTGRPSRCGSSCRSAPGSTPDVVARLIADHLQRKLGQPFVIENKPGASGNTGTDAVAKAAPDGATIGISIGGPLAINTLLFSKLPYDPSKDIAPITQLITQPSALAVNSDVKVNSVAELVALSEARARQIQLRLDRQRLAVAPGHGGDRASRAAPRWCTSPTRRRPRR